MPRKKIILTDKYPYHVISRSNQKVWFNLELQEVWELCQKSFAIANRKYPIRLHAFVLMQNHYHMVLSTPQENLSDFMYEFNKNLSLQLRIQSRNINRMFGGRYKWSLILDRQHYFHVLKYVYLNPNKAHLTEDATCYPFSTLFVQKKSLPFPVRISPFVEVLDQDFIAWVHKYHSSSQQGSIQRGLAKAKFSFSGCRDKRQPPKFDQFF